MNNTESWWSKGRNKSLLGYHSLSICWLQIQFSICVCVCVWLQGVGLTSLCTPSVSQHTLIGSDLGMTHHMPTPHAPADLHLPLSSFPLTSSIHASLLPTHTHPSSLQVFLCSFSHTHTSHQVRAFPPRFASCHLFPRTIWAEAPSAQSATGRRHRILAMLCFHVTQFFVTLCFLHVSYLGLLLRDVTDVLTATNFSVYAQKL